MALKSSSLARERAEAYYKLHRRPCRFFDCPLRRNDDPAPNEFNPLGKLGLRNLIGVTQLIDDLLCIAEKSTAPMSNSVQLTLANVRTGLRRRIPHPLSSFLSSSYHLGFDPVSREYKLLRLFSNEEGAHIITLNSPRRAQLTWRVLDYNAAGISDLGVGLMEARTYRDDGSLCWFIGTSHCVCFDLNQERFRVVELPQDVKYDQNGMAATRFEDGLALWVAIHEECFTVISCYVQEDDMDEGKKWRLLKQVTESGRFGFVEGKLPSASGGGEMVLVDLDQPQRIYTYSFSEHAERKDALFVGSLPEGAPALNKDNPRFHRKNKIGRLSCFTGCPDLYSASV